MRQARAAVWSCLAGAILTFKRTMEKNVQLISFVARTAELLQKLCVQGIVSEEQKVQILFRLVQIIFPAK
jgi:UDP-N-acetylglucosamine enolpyruvyl transferase